MCGSLEGVEVPEARLSVNNQSPGLVVMGRDSCFKGHGLESQHRILDGHFVTFI